MRHRRWTETEDRLIRISYGRAPTRRIAKALGRSMCAVQNRASLIWVAGRSFPPWTEVDIDALARGRAEGVPVRVTAAEIGRTRNACNLKISNLRKQGDARFASTGEGKGRCPRS